MEALVERPKAIQGTRGEAYVLHLGTLGYFLVCLFVCLFVSIYACFCLLVCMLVFHVSLYAGLLEIKQLITVNLIYIYYFTSPENFKVVSVWTLIKRVPTTFAFRALTAF